MCSLSVPSSGTGWLVIVVMVLYLLSIPELILTSFVSLGKLLSSLYPHLQVRMVMAAMS